MCHPLSPQSALVTSFLLTSTLTLFARFDHAIPQSQSTRPGNPEGRVALVRPVAQIVEPLTPRGESPGSRRYCTRHARASWRGWSAVGGSGCSQLKSVNGADRFPVHLCGYAKLRFLILPTARNSVIERQGVQGLRNEPC